MGLDQVLPVVILGWGGQADQSRERNKKQCFSVQSGQGGTDPFLPARPCSVRQQTLEMASETTREGLWEVEEEAQLV